MPGSQLNNYDLVVEFSDQAFQDLLSAFFDTIKPIGNILNQLSGGLVPAGLPFNLTVSFDVPTDIPLPPGTIDTLDVRMTLGTDGSVGTLRFVAKVDVDHTTVAGAQVDLIQLDLSHAGLLYTHLDLFGGVNSTNGVLTTALNALGSIPLLPVPVNRSSTSPAVPIAADMRIIPDSTAAPGASALLLTFGGDAAGNRNAFTQGFVPSGETGAIGVSFDWICNIIRPQLASGLGVPASDFDSPCHLNTTVNLPGDHNPQLTELDLTLANGAISVSAGVGASDTGWNASATVGGSIFIAVQGGNLIITSNIADPSINVSLDWWVWLASAVVGAIVGGIIAGVIGAVVGAIVVPLIVWIASSVINSIIQNVANQIVSALRQLNLNVNVPAIGVNIVFQEINIDDIVIGTQVQFVDNAPIRSQGTLTVYDGQYIDLDNGSVGDPPLQGADLAWIGQEPRRALETLCCGLLARTGGTAFDLTRSQLYRLYYQAGVSIPESELGSLEGSIPPVVIFGITVVPAIPIPGGEIFVPSDLVYAVETDEGRFSIVQVVGGFEPTPPSSIANQTIAATAPTQTTTANPTSAVGLSSSATAGTIAYAARSGIITNPPTPRPRGYISLRYRTFEKPAPSIRTVGGGLTTQGLENAQDVVGVTVPVGQATFVPAAIYPSVEGRPGSFNPGTWWVEKVTKNPRHATIRALTPGIQAKAHHWSINGRRVEGSKGSVKLGDGTVSYQVSGDAMEVSHSSESSLTFEIGVTAVAADGTQQTATTCVQVGGESTVSTVASASWPVFQDAFLRTFGNIDP